MSEARNKVDAGEQGFSLTGPPPGRGWSGLRGHFVFQGERLTVVIRGLRSEGDQRLRYEKELMFRVDPVELGAAAVLSLAGKEDAVFAWDGETAEDEEKWIMRAYWFRRPLRTEVIKAEIERLAKALNAEPLETEKALRIGEDIRRLLNRRPVYALVMEPLNVEGGERFVFVLEPVAAAVVASVCREAVKRTGGVRMVSGLMVVSNGAGLTLAAGSSRTFRPSAEQLRMLRLGLTRALEADRIVADRIGEIAVFAPRTEGENVWTNGLRISVLGRTVPVNTPRDAAKLLTVL